MKASRSSRIALILSACLVMLHASDDVIREDGDVMLASLFEVNEANSDGTCGTFDLQSVRDAYAVQWFVRQLNQKDYIPGVTLGVETWRMCFSHVRAMHAAFRLLDGYLTNSLAQAPLAGIIGPSRTDPAMAVSEMFSSLPENQRVPQISGSATGTTLSNKAVYSNFFRVIPPDGSQIKVITELLLNIRWNYIAIVYTDEEYGRGAAAALLQEVGRHSICVPVFASIPTDTSSLEFNTAVGDIVENMNGKPAAGVSSIVRGAVFIGGRKEAQQFARRLENAATFVEIIFSEALALQTSAMKKGNTDTIIGVVKGALTVTPQYREVEEFRQAWNNLWADCSNLSAEVTDNVWLMGLKDQFSGDCTQLQLGQREQMLFTWYHVQAAAMLAAALKSLHSGACNGVGGPCAEFTNLVKNYELVRNTWRTGLNLEQEFGDVVDSFTGMTNVRFDDKGEVITDSSQPLYEVHNFRPCLDDNSQFCFVKVGDNYGGNVSLNLSLVYWYDSQQDRLRPWPEMAEAQCASDKDCLECLPIRTGDSTLVIPGDFYFVAVAPVHSRNPDDSLQCGNIRAHLGADFVQAIMFALEEVNKEGGRWRSVMPGKTLGAIVMDSCYSPLVIKYKLLQMHKGHIMTPSGPLDETFVKDTLLKRIAGYIGGYFSLISFAMSDVLTKLDRKAYIHLSPTSVASGLSDREQHPYFMRMIVPSNSQVLAMMDMLKKLSATFVQIIYDPVDDYSTDFTKEFENKAGQYGVCVAQKIEAPLQSDTSLYSRILGQLRQKSSARMVIVFLQYEQILQVMDNLIGDGSQLKREDSFIFMGSETWARRPRIIRGKQRLAGAITISEEIAVDSKFTDYFRTVDPVHTTNFWLRDYWEAKKDCYFDLSFKRKGKSRECESEIQKSYNQDPWVSYYIQAVYAFASGVGTAMRKTCPWDEENICPALTASVLVKHMKEVKLDLFNVGTEQRVFNDNGDGENGYKMMQVYWDHTANEMMYRQIGTWTVGGRLSLSVSVTDLYTKLPSDMEPKNYNCSCASEVECQICPSANKTDKVTKDEGQTVPMVSVIATAVILCVIIAIISVVFVVYCRRTRRMIIKFRPTIRFENEGQSTLSFISNPPVQEMYGRGDHPQVSSSRDFSVPPSANYDFIGAVNTTSNTTTPEPPPQPCFPAITNNNKPGYLTVLSH